MKEKLDGETQLKFIDLLSYWLRFIIFSTVNRSFPPVLRDYFSIQCGINILELLIGSYPSPILSLNTTTSTKRSANNYASDFYLTNTGITNS